MEQRKNLCAQVPLSLHTQVTEAREALGQTTSVERVSETDTSGTAATSDNCLTLYTCVRDQRDYRWKVVAVEN